uniref:Uncharacterized protein n=1 Tax=Romanomermis culicivorax TaxID=13658 RepID=A0A915KPK9_ROMCU
MFGTLIVLSTLLVKPVLCNVTLTGGQLAGIIIGCILCAIVLTLAFCALLWILCRKSTKDVARIPIKHKNLTEIGFNLYGNHKEGVFLKDLDKAKFKENVKLNNGDKLIGLEFDVKNLSFIDTFALLNRVLPFTDNLTLVVQKKYGKIFDNHASTNVVSLRSSSATEGNKTKRSHSIIGAADTVIGRSYGSYRRKFFAMERPRRNIVENSSEKQQQAEKRGTKELPESSAILSSKSPKITTRRGSNFDTKVIIEDDDTESKDGCLSGDRFENLSALDRIDLVRLSYESSDKTQSTPNLVNNASRVGGRKLGGSTDSESLDLNLKEPDPLSPPVFEPHQILTKATSDVSHLKDAEPDKDAYDPNNNLLPKIRPASYLGQEQSAFRDGNSTKFVPMSRGFLPNYDSLRALEDKYNIDVDDYEKLLYFEHLLAIQNEHLKTLGISVPGTKSVKEQSL